MTEPQKPVQRSWHWEDASPEDQELMDALLTPEEVDRLTKKLLDMMFNGKTPYWLAPTRTVELSEEMKDLL